MTKKIILKLNFGEIYTSYIHIKYEYIKIYHIHVYITLYTNKIKSYAY